MRQNVFEKAFKEKPIPGGTRETLGLSVTPEEASYLKAKAKAMHFESMTDFLRKYLLKGIQAEMETKTVPEKTAETSLPLFEDDTKTCLTCGKVLPLSCFWKDGRNRYRSHCKNCMKKEEK